MARRFRLLSVVGLGLLFAGVTFAAETAEQFVKHVYGSYRADSEPVSLTGDRAKTILTPSLHALIKRDAAALGGEAGVLDMDPLCVCQDYDLTLRQVTVHQAGDAAAIALVSFVNLGAEHSVRLSLRRSHGVWRIDDIWTDKGAGLRALLEAEIRSLK